VVEAEMPDEPTTFSLFDGTPFDPYADPVQTEGITLEILARGLERTFRFRGQTRRPISVAEHLVRQCRLTSILVGYPDHHTLVLALLDDAHEALTPWGDVPTPCKTPWMRAVERRIDAAIFRALEIDPAWRGEVIANGRTRGEVVKLADELALYFEALIWGPVNAPEWAGDCVSSWDGVPPIARLYPALDAQGDWLEITKSCLGLAASVDRQRRLGSGLD
jgi:hypothetical protein